MIYLDCTTVILIALALHFRLVYSLFRRYVVKQRVVLVQGNMTKIALQKEHITDMTMKSNDNEAFSKERLINPKTINNGDCVLRSRGAAVLTNGIKNKDPNALALRCATRRCSSFDLPATSLRCVLLHINSYKLYYYLPRRVVVSRRLAQHSKMRLDVNSVPLESLDFEHNETGCEACKYVVDTVSSPDRKKRLSRVVLAGNSPGTTSNKKEMKNKLGDCVEQNDDREGSDDEYVTVSEEEQEDEQVGEQSHQSEDSATYDARQQDDRTTGTLVHTSVVVLDTSDVTASELEQEDEEVGEQSHQSEDNATDDARQQEDKTMGTLVDTSVVVLDTSDITVSEQEQENEEEGKQSDQMEDSTTDDARQQDDRTTGTLVHTSVVVLDTSDVTASELERDKEEGRHSDQTEDSATEQARQQDDRATGSLVDTSVIELDISGAEEVVTDVGRFLQEPTIENLTCLGTNAADMIDVHLLSIKDPTDIIQAYVEATLMVSGLSSNPHAAAVADQLYPIMLARAGQQHAAAWLLANTILRALGLIKSEAKDYKIRWHIPSCYSMLATVINAVYFPAALRDTLRFFIASKMGSLTGEAKDVVLANATLYS